MLSKKVNENWCFYNFKLKNYLETGLNMDWLLELQQQYRSGMGNLYTAFYIFAG